MINIRLLNTMAIQKYEKIYRLQECQTECRKFIERSNAWIKRLQNDKYIEVCKEAAACKRTSMDLTRSLTELRRPD